MNHNPTLSEIKSILRYFPPPEDDGAGNCLVCTDGRGGMCRVAAIQLVRDVAGNLDLDLRRQDAPLAQIAYFTEEEELWGNYPEEIAPLFLDNSNRRMSNDATQPRNRQQESGGRACRHGRAD